MNRTQVVERCRTKIDRAFSMKFRMGDGFERVVVQRAVERARAIIPHGTDAEIIAETDALDRLIKTYEPKNKETA